jgi:putative ABC transport system substrate-binding protein
MPTEDVMRIGRRHFISLLGSAAMALPPAAAQQLPVVGFLHSALVESYASNAAAFARGLEEKGFAEAQNLAIEYRFANGRLDRLDALAADLVGRSPAAIVAGGAAAAIAARAATATIPIVLVSGYDPAELGLVASLSRPGGNVTGVAFTTAGLVSRKLRFLRQLVPGATTIGYLAEDWRTYTLGSPISRAIFDLKSEMLAAAGALGVVVAEVGDDHDYGTAFDTFAKRHVGALLVAPSEVFANDADEIVALAERDAIPTMFERRTDVVAGGLISYGASQAEAWRQGGIYVGEILKGAKPAEMPVRQSAELELTINRATASSLGLTIPPSLLAQANEVIE